MCRFGDRRIASETSYLDNQAFLLHWGWRSAPTGGRERSRPPVVHRLAQVRTASPIHAVLYATPCRSRMRSKIRSCTARFSGRWSISRDRVGTPWRLRGRDDAKARLQALRGGTHRRCSQPRRRRAPVRLDAAPNAEGGRACVRSARSNGHSEGGSTIGWPHLLQDLN
jgi:hypothetical protein